MTYGEQYSLVSLILERESCIVKTVVAAHDSVPPSVDGRNTDSPADSSYLIPPASSGSSRYTITVLRLALLTPRDCQPFRPPALRIPQLSCSARAFLKGPAAPMCPALGPFEAHAHQCRSGPFLASLILVLRPCTFLS